MKKIWILCSCMLLILSACATKQGNSDEEMKQSAVLDIGVADAITKIEKQQTFVLLVTRKKCEYCEAMLEMLQETIDQHTIVIYNTILRDDTAEHLQEDIDALKAYVDRPDQTPHYYYIKNGEVQDADKGYTQFQPDRFWEWVLENDMEGSQ